MSREWASVIADQYETGELLWTKGTMVRNFGGDDAKPCYCLTGAIALGVGAEVTNRHCVCGEEDCTYTQYRFRDSEFRKDPQWIERIVELGEWIRETDPHGTATRFDDAEDVIVNTNDDGFSSVADAIQLLRDFVAGE